MRPIDADAVGRILQSNQLLGDLPSFDKAFIINKVKLSMNRFNLMGSLMFQLARRVFLLTRCGWGVNRGMNFWD